MRAVIPIGRGRPPSLIYAVRALEQYAGITELWTVGEHPHPATVTPDRHFDSPNNRGASYLNVQHHLKRVLEETTERFVWTADDTFPLAPWKPGVYVGKWSLAQHLRKYPNKGHYTRAVRASIDIIRGWGFDPEEVPVGAGHRPWLVDPKRAKQTVDAVTLRGEGDWQMVYVAGLEGVSVAGNCKIHQHDLIAPGADMASTSPQSWRYNAGRQIRERFTTPSRWEG